MGDYVIPTWVILFNADVCIAEGLFWPHLNL